MLSVNLFTSKGRTFGKGGLISTIGLTVLGALGKTGNTSIPGNEWLAALHDDQPLEHKKSIWWSRCLLAGHGLLTVVAITTGQWILICIVSLPSFVANIVAYAVGMTQHCGLKQNDSDFRKSVRSIRINAVLEFLYWRMNWHTEHHMFAGVPCYNLKKLHNAVADNMPEPRSLANAWREMLDTWQRQQSDPEYFYDTPVPQQIRKMPGAESAAEAQSIGELAPRGLR